MRTAGPGSFDPAAYDAWFQTPVGRLTDQLEHEAVRALLPQPSGVALDLSCGTGNYALDLAELGWRVVGIDLAPVMLEEARRKSSARHSSACFVAGDAGALPLRDHSIRLVTFILGLEFMPEPPPSLARGTARAPASGWDRHRRPPGSLGRVDPLATSQATARRLRMAAGTLSLRGHDPSRGRDGRPVADRTPRGRLLRAHARPRPLAGMVGADGGAPVPSARNLRRAPA